MPDGGMGGPMAGTFGGLETKFCQFDQAISVTDGVRIEGYASLFGRVDQGGDVVERGAYAASLARLKAAGRAVKLLWQHDPTQPIGIWDEVAEDARRVDDVHVGRVLIVADAPVGESLVEAPRDRLALGVVDRVGGPLEILRAGRQHAPILGRAPSGSPRSTSASRPGGRSGRRGGTRRRRAPSAPRCRAG